MPAPLPLPPHRRPQPAPDPETIVESPTSPEEATEDHGGRPPTAPGLHQAPPEPSDADLVPGWEMADLMAAGILDMVPGDHPVPISVWRAIGPGDPPASPASVFAGLTPRLAVTLLAIYTDPGQMIIDSTYDVTIEGAAGGGGRRYVAVDLPPTPAQLQDLAGQAGLVILRWPPDPQDDPGHVADPPTIALATHVATPDPGAVLGASRDLLSPDGHTVVILAPPAGPYRDHARAVIPAAQAAGLGYLQHVVAITTPMNAPHPPGPRSTLGSRLLPREHLDLLVFILRPGRRP